MSSTSTTDRDELLAAVDAILHGVAPHSSTPDWLAIVSNAKASILALLDGRETAADFFECATCGAPVANSTPHTHQAEWAGAYPEPDPTL